MNTKTVLAFLGLIAAVILVSVGLLLAALLTGSAILGYSSFVELVFGLPVAVFWLVKRLRKTASTPPGAHPGLTSPNWP